MSIRLRLTLLYSIILALTLIALGVGIYISVANLALDAERAALASQARTVTTSLQTHLGPPPGGGNGGQGPHGSYGNQAPGDGQSPPRGPNQGGNQGQGTQPPQWQNVGNFILPQDVAEQNAVQLRRTDGTILYQSSDLKAEHVTLPLSTSARQSLQPNAPPRITEVSVGKRHLLLANVLLASNPGSTVILQVASSLSQLDQELGTLRVISLIGGAIAILAACGAGWWLAGTALRPINRITRTAEEIGATQDFGRRVAYAGPPDEVGRLAGTFNTMLARLQAAYQAQRRFVADASHELRTPLTSIRGNLGLLEREPPIAEADRRAVVADLISESERLSRLVGDLLTLARSDAGRTLRREPVALSPLVTEVLRKLAVLHPDRLIHEGADLEATAVGDPDALTQVLLILLDNALKFTPADGTVTVSTAVHGDTASIAVRDTGAGIAPDAVPHIFERFYQADAARAGMGTGLGLAIARVLVEGMQGTIGVESALGRGSTFTVTLPRAGHGQGQRPGAERRQRTA